MDTAASPVSSDVRIRAAQPVDLDSLIEIEREAFTTDHLSRRSFARHLISPNAAVLVAELNGNVAGYALVFFRSNTTVARLYSIAVAKHAAGQRIGAQLLEAAEHTALARGASKLRLEVHEANARAIARYHKAGYHEFGRHSEYYEDKGHALRFEKRLAPQSLRLKKPPPYVHQTTEFTCGPACVMMALAWADPTFSPNRISELKIWREATTIVMSNGTGGCDPLGLAVALKRRGLSPEIHVNRPGPYFLDTVRSAEKQRVMREAQAEFRREAQGLSIPIHLAPLNESRLIDVLREGAAAIVLVSGYRMVRRKIPHWVFTFGSEGRHILVHDPAAPRDEHGRASATETYAVPADEFARIMRFGKDHLQAAIVIRKGPP